MAENKLEGPTLLPAMDVMCEYGDFSKELPASN